MTNENSQDECIQIIRVTIPQISEDVEIAALITKILARFGFEYLDMSISLETNKLVYSFQRIQTDHVYES